MHRIMRLLCIHTTIAIMMTAKPTTPSTTPRIIHRFGVADLPQGLASNRMPTDRVSYVRDPWRTVKTVPCHTQYLVARAVALCRNNAHRREVALHVALWRVEECVCCCVWLRGENNG